MPKIEVTVNLTPDEFRNSLPKSLQEFFDSMVFSLTENTALSEEEAKVLVAKELLEALKKEDSEDDSDL